MENMEKRSLNLEIRSVDVESRKIVGYASVFSEDYVELCDRWGEKFYERVSPGAFTNTLRDKQDDIFMLINHNWNKVVGRRGANLTIEEDSHGLRFELESPNTTDGNDLLENVRLGLIPGCSFGFNITKQRTKWDESYTNFYRDIQEVELFEISATPIPVYGDTEINARSQLSIRDLRPEAPSEHETEEQQFNERNANLLSVFFNAFNQK